MMTLKNILFVTIAIYSTVAIESSSSNNGRLLRGTGGGTTNININAASLRSSSNNVHQFQSENDKSHHPHHNIRSLRPDIKTNEGSTTNDNSMIIILSQPLSFQIIMSIILSIIILLEFALLIAFYRNQTKRVLEFAQPLYVCMFIASSIITTGCCYFYLYISDVGCTIREPFIFTSLSCMGSIIAGRAWRISSLMSNPIMNAGRASTTVSSSDHEYSRQESGVISSHRVETVRQFVMRAISALSGCDYSAFNNLRLRRGNNRMTHSGGGRPLRVQITCMQMIKAILILCAPQLILQVIVMGLPVLRYNKTLSSSSIVYSDVEFNLTSSTTNIGQYQCQSSSTVSWAIYVFSMLFILLPFGCAYLLNIRSQVEMEKLPQIIDERYKIKATFMAVTRLVISHAPIIGMTYYYNAPAIRAYSAIIVVLGLPIFTNYYVAYIKLGALKSKNLPNLGTSALSQFGTGADGENGGVTGRGSAAYAVKMAEMYSKIGRTEETLELIDETLEVWKGGAKESSGGAILLGDQRRYKEMIGAGFTKQDLNKLAPEELEMILQLLIIKGDALMKLHGFAAWPLSAELNINAMRIYENCPAAKKIKDISIMFPIYNRVGIQLKGGIINQDDTCNLEADLYARFYHEAQVQSYHLVRALGALAEWYGRIGAIDKAFRYFDIMTSIYMPNEHAPLLYKAYTVNRCAVTYAVSALWYLQKSETKHAIKRCDQVVQEILPSYDKKDLVGLFHIFWPIIRVLKWSGEVEKARAFYDEWAPDNMGTHFAYGILHKPMCLLLKICDSTDGDYETDDMAADIDMVLDFDCPDMTDLNLTVDGWSVKTMAAELCLHLARRLEPGNIPRRNLIHKGLQNSTAATQALTTASDGSIKHILAHEAHQGIDDRLLALRMEDNTVEANIIYGRDDAGVSGNENATRRYTVSENGYHSSVNFASKFIVKGTSGTSSSHSNSRGGSSGFVKKSSRSSHDSTGSTGRPFSLASRVSKASHCSRRQSDCESVAEGSQDV